MWVEGKQCLLKLRHHLLLPKPKTQATTSLVKGSPLEERSVDNLCSLSQWLLLSLVPWILRFIIFWLHSGLVGVSRPGVRPAP